MITPGLREDRSWYSWPSGPTRSPVTGYRPTPCGPRGDGELHAGPTGPGQPQDLVLVQEFGLGLLGDLKAYLQ